MNNSRISNPNPNNSQPIEDSSVFMNSEDMNEHHFRQSLMNDYSEGTSDFNFRGREKTASMLQKIQPIYQKNQSSPSKMFKQFNPHAPSKSPYRNLMNNSETSSIGPQT